MIAQGVLPFEFVPETRKTTLTAFAGLPVYLDLAAAIGLRESLERHVEIGERGQGWSDAQVVTSLVLLNLAGGDSVDDLRILEGDSGFGRVLRRTEMRGMSRRDRRAAERRFRQGRQRSVPSPSAARRSLLRFVNRESEAERGPGRAYIPSPSERLTGLRRVNTDLLAFYQKRRPEKHATLDMDATLVESKRSFSGVLPRRRTGVYGPWITLIPGGPIHGRQSQPIAATARRGVLEESRVRACEQRADATRVL